MAQRLTEVPPDDRRRRIMEPVLLVHGIWSAGEWYAGVHALLQPWFHVEPVHYQGFERRGLRSLVATLDERSWWGPVVTLLRLQNNALQVDAALRSVREGHERIAAYWTDGGVVEQGPGSGSGRGHVVAHSWGSCLWWWAALEARATQRLGVLLLLGSPLDPQLPVAWLQKRVEAMHVNTVKRDGLLRRLRVALLVPIVGRMLTSAIRPFVGAGSFIGLHGIRPTDLPGEDAHVITEERNGMIPTFGECGPCLDLATTGWLHQWEHTGHHSTIVEEGWAIRGVVRTALWQLQPADVAEFHRRCRDLVDQPESALAALWLLDSAWGWLGDRSLWSYLLVGLRGHPYLSDPTTTRAYFLVLAHTLAVRVGSAELADEAAFNAVSAQVSSGRWSPPDVAEADDVRFLLHPGVAADELVRTELRALEDYENE